MMSIELRSKETVEINFSKFFFSSKYLSKKHPEIKESIKREITEMINKYEIKYEIIKEFNEIISKEKTNIPIEHYKDIYTLSKHFCIDKLTKYLDNKKDELLLNDLNFSIQILQDNKDTEIEVCKQIENFLTTRLKECIENDKFKEHLFNQWTSVEHFSKQKTIKLQTKCFCEDTFNEVFNIKNTQTTTTKKNDLFDWNCKM